MDTRKLILVLAVALAVVAAGCQGSPGESGAIGTEAADTGDKTGKLSEQQFQQNKEQAKKTTSELKQGLVGKLKSAMDEGGPTQAIQVCTEQAAQTQNEVSRQKGWKITRVTNKVRNPLLGTPDTWEQKVLNEFDKQISEGKDPSTIEHAEVTQETNGQYFRYMSPLVTQVLCTNCHGPKDQLEPEVKQTLKENYPHDQATGYETGELRGAVSIKIPLE